MLPTAEDDAVIAARDTVVFDRDDSAKPTCKQLILDPKSTLTFQSGLGKRTLTVDGPVEIYGAFKMAAQAAGDELALQLSASTAAERTIKVERGGALLVSGRPFAPGTQPNARITVTAPAEGKVAASAEVTVANKGAIDVQNTWLHQTLVTVNGIDNTGAKPNERCNLLGNLFTAQSTVTLVGCDSAVVARNTFEAREGARPKAAAIRVTSCPLAEIRENQVTGRYWFGIELLSSECVVSGNRVQNCTHGIHCTRSPILLKSNWIHQCDLGIRTTLVTGISEELTLEQCPLPALIEASTLQLSGVRLLKPPDKADSTIRLADGNLQLLNCDLKPADISVVNTRPTQSSSEAADPAVQSMAFLVVKLTGTAPRNARVRLQTARPGAPLAAGALDLNVRNSPAPVRPEGTTPLPSTLVPLIVKSWSLNASGTAAESPAYTLEVLGSPGDPGAPPVVLKSITVKPDPSWFRSSPNAPEPTLEVSLP
jgi:parallel beta-helix repeat protein